MTLSSIVGLAGRPTSPSFRYFANLNLEARSECEDGGERANETSVSFFSSENETPKPETRGHRSAEPVTTTTKTMRLPRQSFCVVFPIAILGGLMLLVKIFAVLGSFHASLQASSNENRESEFTVSQSLNAFDFQFRPFEAGKPKMLVILAYQRTGSTFFGRLFNTNPEAFYFYEPLDSLYSSLYGTMHAWNVPTDITSNADGTERIVPDFELEKVSEFLRSLLFCDVDSLPTEAFVHDFMFTMPFESRSLKDYFKCLKQKKMKTVIANYVNRVPWRYCGRRFGQVPEARQNECRWMLTHDEYRRKNKGHANISVFENYLAQANILRRKVSANCLNLFKDACSRPDLRATKVVRASMKSMEPLLRTVPNFRLIHVIRDPRAVVLSRRRIESTGGMFSKVDYNGSMILEAQLYCRTVVADIKVRKELEKRYPGSIVTIVYDDMVRNFRKYAEKVYEFMDSPILNETQSMIDLAEEKGNSPDIADHWKQVLTYHEHSSIWKDCQEFFQMIDYDWPR